MMSIFLSYLLLHVCLTVVRLMFCVVLNLYASFWLFAGDDHKLRRVGPDVINGCDRQNDETDDDL